VSEIHCKPIRSTTADRPMANTSALDCADDASTTGAICSSVHALRNKQTHCIVTMGDAEHNYTPCAQMLCTDAEMCA